MQRSLWRLMRNRGYTFTVVVVTIALFTPLLGPRIGNTRVEAKMTSQSQSALLSGALQVGVEPGANSAGGLQITLSEGAEQPDDFEPIPVAPVEPLASADTQQLLGRLPPLEVVADDEQEFRLPEQTLPPPRPGATITETFPPTQTAALPEDESSSASGPLEVLRFAPEGEIPIAPFLNVTFNQPMVPLATLEQLSAADVPVQLTPEIPGVWKWIGTKTLSFEYQSDDLDIDRFPKATVYTVTVPAGVRSATGSELAEPVTWTFSTPPPRLEYTYPSFGPQSTTPLLFIRFDQGIKPDAVLDTISVTAGGQSYAVRLATQEEIAANPQVQRLIQDSREDRWLAFRAEEAFPTDTTVVVNVGPGVPSAEGPLTTAEVQSYSFTTYAPLRIVEYNCGWGGGECPPFSPFYIRFNNPLNATSFDPALVTVSPEIPGLIVENYGDTLNIRGATQGRTTYEVTLSGEIEDVFGQMLGEDQVLTFQTGPAPGYLAGPNNNFVTLDPATSAPAFTIYTINHDRVRVRIYQVTPDDWPAYLQWQRDYSYQEDAPPPPGVEVINRTVNIEAVEDSFVETNIDLSEALTNGKGHVIVYVDLPASLLSSLFGTADRSRVLAWVQVTQIGLDAFVDRGQMVAWATALQDGAPLAGVALTLGGLNATTAEDGVARFDLPDGAAAVLVGRLGDDVALLPQNTYYWDERGGWTRQPVQDELRWYVFDDRGMYRPGEEVHVKGWLRRIDTSATGDVGLVGSAVTAVQYQVNDPQGNIIAEGAADVNDLGGFDFALTVPESANLGYANIYLSARSAGIPGSDFYHNFQIQEFRRPEFEVTARNEEQGPFFIGDDAIVAVSAQYFAGGPLPNAETTWNVSASPSSYAPPNWPDFVFGKWRPWWFDFGYYNGGAATTTVTYQGRTDATGTHYLRMQFDAPVGESLAESPETGAGESRARPGPAGEPATHSHSPYSVLAEATVMDVNRQGWAATTSLLVHPADLYVGLRSARYFVEKGDPLEIDAIVTDLDGNAVAGVAVAMRAARLEWKYVQNRWQEVEADVQECTVESAGEPVTCTFATEVGGSYRISATIEDEEGRANSSEFQRWVSGGSRPAARSVEQEQVTLVPDQEAYQPGDIAQILVQSPFNPAEGIATVSRGDILYTERFSITDATYTLQVPIEEEHIPNLTVQVDLNGAAPRVDENGEALADAPLRPAYATGRIDLSIPPLSRKLALEVAPEASALAPGAETAVEVVVKDAAGQPVENAELAVVIVDEAILALTNYQLADPVLAFYQNRYSHVASYYGRNSIVLASPQMLAEGVAAAAQDSLSSRAMGAGGAAPTAMPMAAPAEADMMAFAEAADAEESASAQAPITIRSDFNPLATFAPAVRTDADGRARVDLKLPDNLTRYRIMVVAVAEGTHFGSAEANLTARLPLMVRPSAPRFLNFGDRFELPVVIQNQTDEPMQVNVAVRASNLGLESGGEVGSQPTSAGLSVDIPANDRREVRFPATTASAGTARIQIAAASGEYADAAAIELPVYTPATTEAFAVYGVVDEGAIAQPVARPQNVFPQFGGLEINTSSTAVQALTDAVLYLTSYPFECSEQLASRILGVAALRDVLSAFNAEGLPEPAELEQAVQRDIARLQALQNSDGGWPVWTRGKESTPYYSIHVTHALQRAKLKGFDVPPEMLQIALDHLRNIENYYPHYYSELTRHTLSAYALYVRKLMGDIDTAKARGLLNQRPLEEQSLEAVAWLWQVLADDVASTAEVEAIRRHINNRAVETAGAANFTTSYGEQAYLLLHSNRRTDGIVLDALINDQPESDLIPKVVNGLLAHRTAGRWSNTQENAFILLALDRYFNTFESQTPDFVARIWLGETYAGEHVYEGRTTERHETRIPMSFLVGEEGPSDSASLPLILSKEGDGRLYYRLGLRYAPDDLDLDPLEMGFVVQRTYEAVDDAEDVQLDENGVWRIKAGARVRVRLSMVVDNRRYHVALVDPLPAGLEIINPALAVSENIPADPQARATGWWWWGSWFEHQNLRDERAEAFTTLLWDGVYNYTYVARATTPGEFVVPPARAEEMYSPEVFGRSASDRVIVE